jgi:hypothetical protein
MVSKQDYVARFVAVKPPPISVFLAVVLEDLGCGFLRRQGFTSPYEDGLGALDLSSWG